MGGSGSACSTVLPPAAASEEINKSSAIICLKRIRVDGTNGDNIREILCPVPKDFLTVSLGFFDIRKSAGELLTGVINLDTPTSTESTVRFSKSTLYDPTSSAARSRTCRFLLFSYQIVSYRHQYR